MTNNHRRPKSRGKKVRHAGRKHFREKVVRELHDSRVTLGKTSPEYLVRFSLAKVRRRYRSQILAHGLGQGSLKRPSAIRKVIGSGKVWISPVMEVPTTFYVLKNEKFAQRGSYVAGILGLPEAAFPKAVDFTVFNLGLRTLKKKQNVRTWGRTPSGGWYPIDTEQLVPYEAECCRYGVWESNLPLIGESGPDQRPVFAPTRADRFLFARARRCAHHFEFLRVVVDTAPDITRYVTFDERGWRYHALASLVTSGRIQLPSIRELPTSTTSTYCAACMSSLDGAGQLIRLSGCVKHKKCLGKHLSVTSERVSVSSLDYKYLTLYGESSSRLCSEKEFENVARAWTAGATVAK